MTWWRRTRPALPTFLVIGAMKAGTSSLHRYLHSHPEIGMSTTKETDFFLPDEPEEHDLAWYRAMFDAGNPVRGETSPNYTKRHLFPGVPTRVHALVPDARLVYVVRDPVERAVSHVLHAVTRGRRRLDQVDRLLDPVDGDHSILETSRYHWQLEAWVECFDRDRVLVVAAEDLWSRRRATLVEIFRFLDVDDSHDSPRFDERVHVTAERFDGGDGPPEVVLSADVEAALRASMAPDVAALRALTGRSFDAWSL